MTDDEIRDGHDEQAAWSAAGDLHRYLLAKHGVALSLEDTPRGLVLKLVGAKSVRYSYHQPPEGRASILTVQLTEHG